MITLQSRHELETIEITNGHGLGFSFFPHGQLFRATCDDILLNQILGSPVEPSLNNVYLRLKSPQPMTFVPLVGPASPSTFAHAQPTTYGLLFARLPAAARPNEENLARSSAAVLRTTTSLAGPDLALEAARMVVAWAHGFISMELAGAFRLGGDVDRAFAFGIERLGAALAQ